jgi:hypothetical protein
MYMKPRFENTYDHDGNMKHLVFSMEKAIAVMKRHPAKQEKLSLLIDYTDFSLFNAPPMRTSTGVLSILQNQYPERLHKAYIMHAPLYFTIFWNMIYPFIDPVTKEKIRFVGSNMEEVKRQLEGEIDLSQVEVGCGGTDPRPFDSSVYLRAPFDYEFLAAL